MKFVNIKTGNIYELLHFALDCTNVRDGTKVVVYKKLDAPAIYVRDYDEFYLKFYPITHD
jgi:hypothetical protein